MARPAAQSVTDQRDFRRHLRVLITVDGVPGRDVRTCPHCGVRGTFDLDPRGVWYTCSSCGPVRLVAPGVR